ncbi:MAG: peptidoglycan-binding protein [Rhodobacteraceae bacterium]|nr:peptidoglycan-binding protein [Paracoccaceae bacterium]
MQTSAQGVASLEHHEGVVLRAYRDVVGVWTIGAGLTAASGVVKPRAGMVITRAEATTLLQRALRQNYEPAVKAAMPGAVQHAFDAGVSFHFNTGAIRKATWVKKWRAKAAPSAIRAGLLAWNKGGGKVLPGLTRRREDEARMLLDGRYPLAMSKPASTAKGISGTARWALNMSITKRAGVAAELHRLGYPSKGEVISADAVLAFQRDHGLTVDGIIGRATLSTLQRRIDAAAKAKPAVAAPLLASAAPASGLGEALALPPAADWIVLATAAAYALWVAFQYRDAIAAHLNRPLPRVAALLRSF